MWSARRSRRWKERPDARGGRDAPPLRLDGGGHGPEVAEVGRGRGRGRRRAGRDRDRQGEHGLRVGSAGTLVEILAQEGDTLPVGDPIARVGDARRCPPMVGGRRRRARQREPAPSGASAGRAGAGDGGQPRPQLRAGHRTPSCPAASDSPSPAQAAPRRPLPQPLATGGSRPRRSRGGSPRKRGLDLHGLSGSGPGGRIVKADVERALAAGVAAPGPAARARHPPAPAPAAPAAPTPGVAEKPETAKGQVEVVELTKLQQTVARRMAESKATAPHFYLQAEFDMTAAVEGRAKLKEMAKEGEPVPDLQRHGREGVRDRAARASPGERRLSRRADRALLAGERRGRGRRSGRPGGSHRLRRGPEGAAADLERNTGARGPGPRRDRSPRRSSRAGPSRSPTSACTGSRTSTP